MPLSDKPWQEQLGIIDQTMRAISSERDPGKVVDLYYDGVGSLIPIQHYMSLSRRGCQYPTYVVTRSSRTEDTDVNPFVHFDSLPRRAGGLIAEAMYGNKPVIIDDLPAKLSKDDPAYFYLEGFQSIVILPQYEDGEANNCTCLMVQPGQTFDFSILPMLHWHASLFGRGVRNLVLRNELQKTNAALDKEMQVVGDIQLQLLPKQMPDIAGTELATHYLTSARAGGDYYDFFPLDHGQWGLFIADVSGHGTPAAVLMAITHALAHARPGDHAPPATLLQYLNQQLTSTYARSGTFVTAFYAVLDPAKRTLTYARAGHNPPRLMRAGDVMSLEEIGAMPMGIEPDQFIGEATVTLQSGDLLLLYTDGITEAMSGTHELFSVERLDQVLLTCANCTARETIGMIKEAVDQFTNNSPAKDDQTLIAMRVV
jgi:sigma-B regulation protein RsbU (phosphoserine phosphatase)